MPNDFSTFIERQEAQGQADFCASEELPCKIEDATRAELEAMGFRFGDPVDDLFMQASLPAGWRKEATSHSMWSRLVDAQGHRRASIFYKAAFYDREAFMRFDNRFGVSRHEDGPAEGSRQVVITDALTGNTRVIGVYTERDWDTLDRLQAQATAWLAENYPNWRQPLAYWDETPTAGA